MSNDIRRMMQAWSEDEPVVRRITGDDGRPVIQRRLSLGILQIEESGRPDGLRPFGFETLATHIYAEAARGTYEDGAVAALMIVLAGLGPVVLLARMSRPQLLSAGKSR